ncbi:MAG: peptide-methionine (S)-S-oxide reductase [Candidatus Staskawiczbacteria bacterium]|nr:peptide-methionine (S)-S-oxide reductase [Candidatus Staskawiczbacteria bacterium]
MEKNQAIVLGGGCFWCTEAVFKMLKGVVSVESGYAGEPRAEVIKIEYDSAKIPLQTLLTVFFASHDPTTKDRQGNDVGPEYRSIILYSTEEQKQICEKFIQELNGSSELGAPITTEVKSLEIFYPAEDYHKNYYENNKGQAYCQVVINPKLRKVQEKFAQLLKEK